MHLLFAKTGHGLPGVDAAGRKGRHPRGISLLEVMITLALVGTLGSLVSDVFLQFSRIQMSSDKSTAAVTTIPEVFTLINHSLHTMAPLIRREIKSHGRSATDTSAKSAASPSARYFLKGTDTELMLAVESLHGTPNLHSYSGGAVSSRIDSMALRESRSASVTGEFVPAHSHHIVVAGWDADGRADNSQPATATVLELFAQPADMRFEYFDGVDWFLTWDSSVDGNLPVLIRISISATDGATGPDWFAPITCSLRLPPGLMHLASQEP